MQTRQIVLPCGLVVLVDEHDYWQVSRHKWHSSKGSTSRTFYARSVIAGKNVMMHRLIMGAQRGIQVDHIDCNGLNNCRANLRIATPSQNQFNKCSYTGSRSRFKGVTHHKNGNGWQAEIRANRRKFYLGFFKSELDAARAYNRAALELHGEFARLNEVPA